jgi:hypothetical protein
LDFGVFERKGKSWKVPARTSRLHGSGSVFHLYQILAKDDTFLSDIWTGVMDDLNASKKFGMTELKLRSVSVWRQLRSNDGIIMRLSAVDSCSTTDGKASATAR